MNKPLSTEFNIGDLVYTARASEVDRDVIKAIKFEGLKNKVSYGFKRNNAGYFSFFYDSGDYRWFSANDVFATEEEAEKVQKQLKRKEEAEQAKEKLKEIAKLEDDIKASKERLRRKKLGLPETDDEDDDDED